MKISPLSFLLATGLLVAPDLALGQASHVPTLVSYQGRVTDNTGTLIGNTAPVNRTVEFRLYTVASGGTPIWAESQVVTISAGEFSVLIGNGTGITGLTGPSAPAATPFRTFAAALNSSASAALYLGVTVDDGNASTIDVEISPRQQLVAGPFALRAGVAESVASAAITSSMIGDLQIASGALQTSAVTTTKVADAAITSAKIADGAILAVDLASGAVTADKIDSSTVGLWSVTGGSVFRAGGNVGIQTNTPGFPLSFSDASGDKISFYGQSGAHYGVGLGSALLQIHTGRSNEDVAFGFGTSASFSETVRIKGNGNMGIGTSTPGFPLNFANALGDKISLFGNSGAHYGFGIQGALLQIHTDSAGADVAFGYGTSAGFTETVRIKGNGRLGIGTNSPASVLSIYEPVGTSIGPNAGSITLDHGNSGGASSIVFRSCVNATSDFGYIQYQDSSGLGVGGESARLYIGTSNDGDDHLILNPAGFVGIKNNNPAAPLHVSGAQSNAFTLEAYLDGGGAFNTSQYRTDLAHSIISDGRIRAGGGVDINSDSRIKTQQKPSDGAADLAVLRRIQITDYRYIDVPGNGGRPQKKVIAQQVEQVYPQAVGRGRGGVPDIYKPAALKGGWVQLATDLKQGERVRLITEKGDDVYAVLEVGVGSFRTSLDEDTDKLFVYGREVDDFRFVDYDAISMLNVSATQVLDRKLELEHKENVALKEKVAGLEARLAALEKLLKASK
jgi:hypothetical protein